jgi:hypothetical protein
VLNRLNDPCLLLHIEDWAEARGILEIYHIRPEELNDDRLGRALDAIAPYIADIEEAIVFGVLSRFGKIDTDQILWDLTSFYFEGDHDDSEMIKFGYNRDQKKDKKQAVVELNVRRMAHEVSVCLTRKDTSGALGTTNRRPMAGNHLCGTYLRQELIDTAGTLVAGDKGLLAMDESNPTCNERRWFFRLPAPSSNRLWRFGMARMQTCCRRSELCIIEPGATWQRAVVNTAPPWKGHEPDSNCPATQET